MFNNKNKKINILLSTSNEYCGPNCVVNDIWKELDPDLKLIYLFKRDEKRYFGENLKPLNFIKFVFSNRSKINLIHSHLFWADLFSLICKLILRGRFRWISTVHMSLLEDQVDYFGKFYGWIRASIWLFILSFSDEVVVLNRKMLNEYSKKFNNVSMIGNGINYSKFRKESKNKNNSLTKFKDVINVAMITRFTKNKGIEGVVKSLARLTRFNFKFILIGYGEKKYEKQLLKSCRENLSKKRFLFLGRQTNIANLLSKVDIFVVNSDYEGFPINLLEAMSISKIIVAPKHEPYSSILKSSDFICDFIKKDNLSLDNALTKAFDAVLSGKKKVNYEMEIFSNKIMAKKYKKLYKIHV